MTMFYLGYDQSCSVCARTGERIAAEIGGDLSVIPLQAPRMAEYRERALGSAAPWAPTLIRVDGDRVDAWTGWRMSPVLTRVVGVSKASRILSIVGQEQVRSGRTAPGLRRIGRRPFLGFVASAAVGALTLSGVSSPAFAGTPRGARAVVGDCRHDAAVSASALALLDGVDARVAFVDSFGSRSVRAAADNDRYRSMSFSTDDALGRHTSVGVHDTRDGLIYRAHETRSGTGEVVDAGAEVYEIRSNGETLRVRSRSINGAAPETMPARIVQASRTEADPCGGCTGPGGPGDMSRKSATECVSDIDVACALSIAGCVGCVPTCTVANAPGAAACGFCLVTSCGSLIASNGCCKGDGSTRQVCTRCSMSPNG